MHSSFKKEIQVWLYLLDVVEKLWGERFSMEDIFFSAAKMWKFGEILLRFWKCLFLASIIRLWLQFVNKCSMESRFLWHNGQLRSSFFPRNR